MSDTPRTDALFREYGINELDENGSYWWLNHARQLERALAAANEWREAVHKGTEQSETPPKRVALPNFGAIDYWEDRARKAEAERDAMLEAFVRKSCGMYADDAPGLRGECADKVRSGNFCPDCPKRWAPPAIDAARKP